MRPRPLLRVVSLAAALVLAACFNPKLEPGFQCGEDPPGPQCPDGFFCDPVSYTCLLDGTPATAVGVSLGQAFPGLVAARLGDGVVVAGWFLGPNAQPEFQVHRYNQDGTTMHPVSLQPLFNGVDRGSLKATGAKDVAVIVGRAVDSPSRLVRLWVYASRETVEALDEGEMTAHAVASFQKRACFVRVYPGTAPSHVVELVCHDGASVGAPWQTWVDSMKPIQSVAAAVTDDPNDDVVIVERPKVIDVGLSKSELVANCASQAGSVPLGRFRPQGGDDDLLRPKVKRAPDGTGVLVGWTDVDGLTIADVDPMCSPMTPRSFHGPVKDFAVAGGPAAGVAGVRSVSLRGDPALPMADDWLGLEDTSIRMEPYHDLLSNPHAVTDARNDFWFLFYASDVDDRQGWIKCASWTSIHDAVNVVGVDSGTVTADYAAAPRTAGGFFVVTRNNPDNRPVDESLEAFLVPTDEQLDTILPPIL